VRFEGVTSLLMMIQVSQNVILVIRSGSQHFISTMILWNVRLYSHNSTASHPRRLEFSDPVLTTVHTVQNARLVVPILWPADLCRAAGHLKGLKNPYNFTSSYAVPGSTWFLLSSSLAVAAVASLVTGLYFLVLLLKQWWSPPPRLQVSHCS